MTWLRHRWDRFLHWRRAEGVAPVQHVEDSVPNKVDADQGDVIREKFSNRGGGWGTS